MIDRVIAQKYKILSLVGEGGMAKVYKAKRLDDDHVVAIKFLRSEYNSDADFVERFGREATSAAMLNHPHIMGMIEWGQDGEDHYLVMEFLDGITLKEMIQQQERLSTPKALILAMQICKALANAHQNGIIHRDIKPQNIIIDDQGNAKVADFGLARATSSQTITMAGSNVLGSVHYFSPEMAKGSVTSEQTDLYSLGVVFYEMITGRVPFEGETPVTVAMKQINEPISFPDELEIPFAVCQIIRKATNKIPTLRYRSARAMLADLQKAVWEPEGDFVKITEIDQDGATQFIPIIPDSEKTPQQLAADKKVVQMKILRLGIIVFVVIGLFLVMFLLARSIGGNAQSMTRVNDDYVGLTRVEAMTQADLQSLKILFIEQSSHDVPAGQVIEQTPKMGGEIESNKSLQLIISTGPEELLAPDLSGMDLDSAQQKLIAMGLEVGEIVYSTNSRAAGEVYEQFPLADTVVSHGAKVDLYISGEAR